MPTIERWTPVRELDRMERAVRRLFEDAGVFSALPATDIYETDDEFVVEIEVPGFEEHELDVEVMEHTLVVKGMREEHLADHERMLLRERLERAFVRRFELPSVTEPEQVRAEFDKGVLTVHVPKTGPARPRRVEITPG